MGQWSCLEFRFLCVLGGWQTPQDGLQGVDWIKSTPALQVVIVSHLLGEHKRDGNRMNSSDSWRCGILGVCPC